MGAKENWSPARLLCSLPTSPRLRIPRPVARIHPWHNGDRLPGRRQAALRAHRPRSSSFFPIYSILFFYLILGDFWMSCFTVILTSVFGFVILQWTSRRRSHFRFGPRDTVDLCGSFLNCFELDDLRGFYELMSA